MLKFKYVEIAAVISAMTLAATVEAQTVIGSFQGSSDGNNGTYWQDASHGYSALSSDSPYATFPAGVVPNYTNSLELNPEGASGYTPQIQGVLTAAQVAAFNTNSYITFTFSVPTSTNGVALTSGYYQLVNLYIQEGAGGNYGGYQNLIAGPSGWAGLTQFEPNTAGDTSSTNNNQSGEANFYFGAGEESEFSEVVTINYSTFLTNNAVLEGDTTNGLVLGFQFNQSDGSPMYLNNVVLSQGPFGGTGGAPALPSNEFVVDNFSASGVGPQNPANDDYFPTAENYADGQITNVWVNYFGSTFVTDSWAQGVSPSYAPSAGSLEVQLNWASGGNFAIWENGAVYGPDISALTYTNFQCDVMFAEGSATDSDGTFGNLQFGTPAGNGQDFFGGANYGVEIPGTNGGVWQHVSIALNPVVDTNLLNISSVFFHIYPSYTGGNLSGPSTLYIDNIQFTGPTTVAKVPLPVMTLNPAVPGLRMFVGNSADYIREGVITTEGGAGEQESWVGSGVSYPVNYSFQLLSYPATNINTTELAILPENGFNPNGGQYQTTIYNNPFLDYQDSNGLYLTLTPNGGGAVTATVQWKIGLASAGPTNTPLTLTSPTAIGTWTLTMNGPTSGSVTGPGGVEGNFTITDATVAVDFANPTVAVVAEDPNTTAGYGLYEDIGTISITGLPSGPQTENFSAETSDFVSGTSPGGYFQNNYSVDPGNLVIVRNGLDKYWASWTADLNGAYNLVTDTNLLIAPTNWLSPDYYSGYNIPDESAPRGVAVNHAPNWWELLPADDLPTVDGGYQTNAPAIQDPLAPDAFFMLTTNNANIFPVIP
ncbi:MAG TPA: hypothetical protein VMF08_05850 [Candidatus Sulfotelmatobacter sp.]|nr:hypothetical protein [Candidatus Sulfotelmatobacter sp.]